MPVGTPALVPIASLVLDAPKLSVTFSGIPQSSFRDLVLIQEITMTGLGASTGYPIGRINGDSGANYSRLQLQGNGSAAGSGQVLNETSLNYLYGVTTTQRAIVRADFLDYSATDKHKTVLFRQGNPQADVLIAVVRWASTAAITTLSLSDFSGFSFAAGSSFSLYGVSA